jgi:hypothetical protein
LDGWLPMPLTAGQLTHRPGSGSGGACNAAASGDGFADGFPTARLAALLAAKLARPQLAKTDWVAFGAVSRICNKMHVPVF